MKQFETQTFQLINNNQTICSTATTILPTFTTTYYLLVPLRLLSPLSEESHRGFQVTLRLRSNPTAQHRIASTKSTLQGAAIFLSPITSRRGGVQQLFRSTNRSKEPVRRACHLWTTQIIYTNMVLIHVGLNENHGIRFPNQTTTIFFSELNIRWYLSITPKSPFAIYPRGNEFSPTPTGFTLQIAYIYTKFWQEDSRFVVLSQSIRG